MVGYYALGKFLDSLEQRHFLIWNMEQLSQVEGVECAGRAVEAQNENVVSHYLH